MCSFNTSYFLLFQINSKCQKIIRNSLFYHRHKRMYVYGFINVVCYESSVRSSVENKTPCKDLFEEKSLNVFWKSCEQRCEECRRRKCSLLNRRWRLCHAKDCTYFEIIIGFVNLCKNTHFTISRQQTLLFP